MSGRMKGSTCDIFEPESLIADLKPYAAVKNCAFDFELAQYAKTRRSQAADREGLAFYKVLLAIILSHCPHGYPSLLHLKLVWKTLQDKFHVMSKELFPIYHDKIDAWTSLCCEKVRLACRHVVDLKRSQTTFVSSELQSLMDLVVVRSRNEPPSTIARARSLKISIATPEPSSDESALICCGFSCKCDDCKPTADVVTVLESPSDCESETSVAARANCEHVPASRGGQKRAAEKKDDDEEPAAKPKKPKTASAKKKPAAKPKPKPPAAEQPAEQPAEQAALDLKIVTRNRPEDKRECYIMKNGKFLVACKEKACASYKAVIAKLVEEMHDGTLAADKELCKARLSTLMLNAES
jgi:hypothetical protein